MTVTTEVLGLEAVQAWAADLVSEVTKAAAAEVLAESTQLQTNIVYAMPVDTGWAMSRWGNPEVVGGVWEASEDGLEITQGSDLESQINHYEYIIRLNEGSSMQAPAGFIDTAADRAGDRLEARLDTIADTVG